MATAQDNCRASINNWPEKIFLKEGTIGIVDASLIKARRSRPKNTRTVITRKIGKQPKHSQH
jgi:hypothetical protein